MTAPSPATSRAPLAPEHRPLRALVLILLASASFALVAMTVKELGNDPRVGVAPPVLSRGLCGVLVCVYWARRGDVPLVPSGWTMLALRCLSGVGAVGLYYRSLGPGGTDMVTAAMLLKTSPLWVALLSPVVLGERPTPRIWSALVVGLAGVVVVSLDPAKGWRPNLANLGVALSLIAGVCSAFAYMSLRRLATTDHPVTVVGTFSVALALGAAPFVVARVDDMGAWSTRTWLVLGAAGVLGTAGQLFLTAAYRWSTAAAVTIAGLSEVGMQGVLSVVRFGEVPSREALIGGLLAMSAGLLASARMRRPVPAAAPATTSLPTGLVVDAERRDQA